MPSHTAPPPPFFHHSLSQSRRAFFIAAFSKAFGGIRPARYRSATRGAGHRVVGVEEAARRTIAAAGADDHLALGDARRHRHRVVILRERDARFPDHLAGFGVERLQRPSMTGAKIMPL
jgi:hypothetical protein